MSAVKTVTEKVGSRGDKNAILTLEDGKEMWTPSYEKALPLLGKEIPADWFIRDGEYGLQVLPPKDGTVKLGGYKGGGGGKATWYNSEEGVRFTQERMDRRTALMQAVETYGSRPPNMRLDQYIEAAELFYDWLRETSPAVPSLGKAGVAETVAVGEQTNSPAAASNEYPADWPVEGR